VAPVVAGAPFVLSPEYDVRLNGFFASARMRSLASGLSMAMRGT
jgi:hypothetical protein